jgi:hypothetical protein
MESTDSSLTIRPRHETVEKGRPISGVLGTANSCTAAGPARNALRPALTTLEKATATLTGSIERETAVFSSLPSKPHSMARQAWEGTPMPASKIKGTRGARLRNRSSCVDSRQGYELATVRMVKRNINAITPHEQRVRRRSKSRQDGRPS